MKIINIDIEVKNRDEVISLILYKKIYSTPNGIVEHWSTDLECKYRLEVIIDEEDVVIDPLKIVKDFDILTNEEVIADQITAKIVSSKVSYYQNV